MVLPEFEQQDIDLGIDSSHQPSESQSASKSPHGLLSEALAELRQKSRLYATGGGIHFGIPPEERSSTKYWNK
jgi:hypothetical protein